MPDDDHSSLASRVRSRLEQGPGETDPALRRAVAGRAAGGPAAPQPYDDLAGEIGEASYRVTDAQVAAVRAAAGTDKAAFEIVMAAAIGAGLMRWDKAMAVLEAASDATA